MLISPVKTDEHLRELVNYKDISFPLDVPKRIRSGFYYLMPRSLQQPVHHSLSKPCRREAF